jgi:2-oxoisovalerate dehydrogenase E1 component
LLATAFAGNDPTFVLVPKHIFRKQRTVERAEPIPFGVARIVATGKDVTLVTWGNCVELAEEAVAQVSASVEIIDLRSIVPCDYDAIEASVKKTGRLVVVHEDNRTCGFGQAIIAEMMSKPSRFDLFLSPPQLVAREDVHIGYHPIYEYAALPDIAQVVAAIEVVMS